MPTDPAVCRWCHRHLSTFADGETYCDGGCASNDNPLYVADCAECGREFATGQRLQPFCWPCLERQKKRETAEVGGVKSTGYMADMTRKHVGRRATEADREPPDPDGEIYRGSEAAAAQQDAQAEAWKLK
jgi:hypothetical protein